MNESDEENTAIEEETPIQMLTSGKAMPWCRRSISAMTEAIQESAESAELAQATSAILKHVLCTAGSRTFPDTQLNKTFVRKVSAAFRDKVEELGAASGTHA